MDKKINIYTLSRNWFNWCFENPEKISPNHTALYFYCIDLCNRLGWKEKFGLPTNVAKETIGIKSYNTYINTLNNLINWGFIIMIQKSTNQHTSNIVALSNFNKALDRPLDKANVKIDSFIDKKEENNVKDDGNEICSIKFCQSNCTVNIQEEKENNIYNNIINNNNNLSSHSDVNNNNLIDRKILYYEPINDEFYYKEDINKEHPISVHLITKT